MSRVAAVGRVVAAAVLLAGVLHAGNLALPRQAFACYCAPPETVAVYRTDVDVVIVSGTVLEWEEWGGEFRIDRVFKGPVPARDMSIKADHSTCGLFLKAGNQMIFAAHIKDGALAPSVCMSFGRIPSPDADALIADAEAAFGGAGLPPAAPDDPAAATVEPVSPASPASTIEDPLPVALMLVGLAVALSLALFGGLIWLLRRRQATT